jgi:hypothetical protein
VFPVQPRGKSPALGEDWQTLATRDPAQITAWWTARPFNVGIETGRSGLLVVDLDPARGHTAPDEWAGATGGREVLERIANAAAEAVPDQTYTVTTPSGGTHLYFRQPNGLALRNTQGSLGWRIDTRGHGGYVVGAGSVREDGYYRVTRHGRIEAMPGWLAAALTPPPPPPPGEPKQLPRDRAGAYVRAIVESEAHDVAAAQVGSRHHTLLKAARTLGRLVGGGEHDARDALHDAAARHIGVDGTTAREIEQTIDDGIAYGKRLPRTVNRSQTSSPARPTPFS